MQTTVHSLLLHVYAKTRKGHDEIVRPKFGLNSRQRRILIFVDGIKTLSTLRENFPIQEMEDIVSFLSGQHFIFMIGKNSKSLGPFRDDGNASARKDCGSPPDTCSPSRINKPVLTRSPEKILKAREFMLEVAVIHLGILGRDIIQKIEAADCAQSLAGVVGQWTMALCASKTAARYAQLYLEQLKLILFEPQEERCNLSRCDMSSWSHMNAL